MIKLTLVTLTIFLTRFITVSNTSKLHIHVSCALLCREKFSKHVICQLERFEFFLCVSIDIIFHFLELDLFFSKHLWIFPEL
jgi:hypothetical protein